MRLAQPREEIRWLEYEKNEDELLATSGNQFLQRNLQKSIKLRKKKKKKSIKLNTETWTLNTNFSCETWGVAQGHTFRMTLVVIQSLSCV